MPSLKDLQPYSKTGATGQFPLEGFWRNELGSTMEVKRFDGTTFTGTYTSAVSADGTAAKGTVSGTVAGDAIAFCVNWKQAFESVTAWSGLLLSDGKVPTIYTLWHLASTPEKEEDAWESILAGTDRFVPVK